MNLIIHTKAKRHRIKLKLEEQLIDYVCFFNFVFYLVEDPTCMNFFYFTTVLTIKGNMGNIIYLSPYFVF